MTVIVMLNELFDLLLSVIRLRGSTYASTVWLPALASHVEGPDAPPGPRFAVRVTDAPGASEIMLLSEVLTGFPSTKKLTPMLTPLGVAAIP